MNRNVEIKAKVESLDDLERRTRALADEGPVVLEQEDTFFVCPHGRLKLRRLVGGAEGELIYYERPDTSTAKESRYAIQHTSDATGLWTILSAALGIRGVVRKRRTLYLIGPTRVHLDRVERLGAFVELEVVLAAGQSVRDGRIIADKLMKRLEIAPANLVQGAYIDLLKARCS